MICVGTQERRLLQRVVIPGHPRPKGSMKCVGRRGARGHVLIESGKHVSEYRKHLGLWVRAAALPPMGAGVPVAVNLVFALPRPASHYGTGRNAGVLKASAPLFPLGHGTGDVDKLSRMVLDVLQDAGVIEDDAQVASLYAVKVWAKVTEAPHVEMVLHQVGAS